jgi:hypothetical protein
LGLDRQSGQVIWEHPIKQVGESFTVDEGLVYVQADENKLSAFDVEGRPQWEMVLGQLEHSVQVEAGIVIVAATHPSRLVALDRMTGRKLWDVELPAEPTAGPSIQQNEIYVPTLAAIGVHSLLDGSLKHSVKSSGQVRFLSVAPERIVAITAAGKLLTGGLGRQALRELCDGIAANREPMIGVDSIVIPTRSDGLVRLLHNSQGEAQPWFKPERDVRLTASPVVANDRVYLPVKGVGLICLQARSVP